MKLIASPRTTGVLLGLILAQLLMSHARGQGSDQGRPLRVAVKETPAFAMRDRDGTWSGISVELWRAVAERMKVSFEFQEAKDLNDLLSIMERGEADVGLGALTITSEREARMDFSHGFFSSGLGIAVSGKQEGLLSQVLSGLLSTGFLKAVGALLIVLLGVGVVMWLFERRRNQHFQGPAAHGVGEGFWWAAVTMTTVGYGDRYPETKGGRAVGFVWMFASILLISTFTAAIASSLTVSRMETKVAGPEDLPKATVGTIRASTGESYVVDRGYGSKTYANVDGALLALSKGEVDAVVYDAPLLRYTLRARPVEGVDVLPHRLDRQSYGIALSSGNPLKEALNRELLAFTVSDPWGEILLRWLGSK